MSISINSKIYLNNLSNPENSLVDSIKILSDFTIRDIKKIENDIAKMRLPVVHQIVDSEESSQQNKITHS